MIKPDPSTGFYWRKKKTLKKKNKLSGTCPGKSKGTNCQTTALMKTLCSRNRSYKHQEYGALLKLSKASYPSSWR